MERKIKTLKKYFNEEECNKILVKAHEDLEELYEGETLITDMAFELYGFERKFLKTLNEDQKELYEKYLDMRCDFEMMVRKAIFEMGSNRLLESYKGKFKKVK